jgi:hypothetical protein
MFSIDEDEQVYDKTILNSKEGRINDLEKNTSTSHEDIRSVA